MRSFDSEQYPAKYYCEYDVAARFFTSWADANITRELQQRGVW